VCSSCVIFSSISPNLPFDSFSLYRRPDSATLLWNKCPISCHMRPQSLQCQRAHGLWSVNRNQLCAAEIWPFDFFTMAANCHLRVDPTGNGTVRCAVPKNPTLESNTKWIGWRFAELWSFEMFQTVWIGPEVGRSLFGPQYSFCLHWALSLR